MVFVHLLDIEGTVCPISFVKEVLYPYALETLPEHLSTVEFPVSPYNNASNPLATYLLAFPSEHTQSAGSFLDYVHHLTEKDIKLPAWKALQGYLWRFGYTSGAITVPLFDDAIRAIKRWDSPSEGKYVAIYSSGSVAAQKLLFKHVKATDESADSTKSIDLNGSLCGYFDTTTAGFKHEKSSYEYILSKLGEQFPNEPLEVLFLSDNVKEVRAAREGGMRARGVDRPDNYELTPEEREEMDLIMSFDEL